MKKIRESEIRYFSRLLISFLISPFYNTRQLQFGVGNTRNLILRFGFRDHGCEIEIETAKWAEIETLDLIPIRLFTIEVEIRYPAADLFS
jgi:hypothetical protein